MSRISALLLFAPLLFSAAFGPTPAFAQQIGTQRDTNGTFLMGSTASPVALNAIQKTILSWVRAHETPEQRAAKYDMSPDVIKAHQAEFIQMLNGLLRNEKQPQIDSSAEVKLNVSMYSGIAPGPHDFAGVSVVDKNNKFCLPCQIGLNNMVWGVIPFAEAPRNTNGPFYKTLSCFENMDKIAREEHDLVNSLNRPGTKFITIPGKNAGREGFYAITDDGTYFYPAKLPGGFSAQKTFHNELCTNEMCAGQMIRVPNEPLMMATAYKITLPNGKKTEVLFRVNLVSDPAHPGPASERVDGFEVPYDQGITNPDGTPPTDLGQGAGDKAGTEVTAAIQGELVKRFGDLKLDEASTDHPIDSKQACAALDQCGGSGSFDKDRLAQLNQAKSDLRCPATVAGVTEPAFNLRARSLSPNSGEQAL